MWGIVLVIVFLLCITGRTIYIFKYGSPIPGYTFSVFRIESDNRIVLIQEHSTPRRASNMLKELRKADPNGEFCVCMITCKLLRSYPSQSTS